MRRFLLLPLLAVSLSGCLHRAIREVGSDAMVTPLFHLPPMGWGLPPSTTFHVQTADGLKLEGERFTPEGASRGLVLFLHGRDGARMQGNSAVKHFVARGYTVVTYDQRGHGRSEGQFMTYGAREVDDARRVLSAQPPGPVYLLGHSMGAAVSLQLAAVDPRVQGVIAASSFADLLGEWRDAAPRALVSDELMAATSARAQEKAGFDAAAISPERSALHIAVPVLLLHGTDDALIAPSHSRRILRALGDHGSLVLLQGVQHNDVLEHEETWTVIEAWCQSHLPPAEPVARR